MFAQRTAEYASRLNFLFIDRLRLPAPQSKPLTATPRAAVPDRAGIKIPVTTLQVAVEAITRAIERLAVESKTVETRSHASMLWVVGNTWDKKIARAVELYSTTGTRGPAQPTKTQVDSYKTPVAAYSRRLLPHLALVGAGEDRALLHCRSFGYGKCLWTRVFLLVTHMPQQRRNVGNIGVIRG
jgi:hypothetical protein